MIATYRRKTPEFIRAVQWDGTNKSEVDAFIRSNGHSFFGCDLGDWIVKGEDGMLRSISDLEFLKTFELRP